MRQKTVLRALVLAALAAPLARCTNQGTAPVDYPPSTDPNAAAPCNPARAGLTDTTTVTFQYFHPPDGCMFDPVGRAGSCNVGGCTVKNVFELVEGEDRFATYLGCTAPGTPSGIDFTASRVVVVRQGMRVGETMGVEPVGWLVSKGNVITMGERRQSFCTGGALLTGGVVSYAITMPVPTSSTATIARHICFRRTKCDCSSEEDCPN